MANFYVERRGWGFVIEASDDAVKWLTNFLRRKPTRANDAALADELLTKLKEVK